MGHVLLVEDNLADVVLVREVLLELEDAPELHTVDNGVDALAFLCRTGDFSAAPPVDLVLLDLHTPRLGGLELLRAVRSDVQWQNVRLVVFSSSVDEADRRRASALGADAFERKPAGWEAFSQVVRDIFIRWAHPPVAPSSPEMP